MPTRARIALVATSTIAIAVLTGCGGSSAGSGKFSPVPVTTPTHTTLAITTSPATVPSSSSAGAASTVSATLDSTGWLAGFTVRVSGATYDASTKTVTVNALLTNASQVDRTFSMLSAEISLDPGDSSGLLPLLSTAPNAAVVAATSAKTTLSFQASTAVALDKAVLVLGKAANHQWLVPLAAGVKATGESPVTLTSPGRVTTAGTVYFDITSAELLPWSCSGITPFTAFIPFAKTTSIIALRGTIGTTTAPTGGTGLESLSLTAPDGTTAAVITPPLKVWQSNQSTPDLLQCIPVPAHLSGTYVLKITDSQRNSATANITIP